MHASVGYSDNPDTSMAGMQAAMAAIKDGGGVPCDWVLMFATSRHDATALREAVSSIVGINVPIIGGGSIGAISNEAFGYAGDQIILAAFWMEGIEWKLFTEPDLIDREAEAGEALGHKLSLNGVDEKTPVLFFYDAINRTGGDLRLILATYLLQGIEKGLGFLPNLVGAGLQGDYVCTPARQWSGKGITEHSALAVTFSGDLRMDSVIMHGCRPSTGYYTVTRAEGQTILEINGEPALDFMDTILGSSIPVENYPFFLIFGVNKGEKWEDFDENNYASRLCLAIDADRRGIVMFEPDMTEGTEFQVMYKSLDLDYMPPRMEKLFENIKGRKPVIALYINCAGRAAGYAGLDFEDAVEVQKATRGKVPLMGIYTGVEIAPVRGRPQALDWTGVFCLFSVPE